MHRALVPESRPGNQDESQNQNLGASNPDLAGVLRRNQACLNCRRRKLASLLTLSLSPFSNLNTD